MIIKEKENRHTDIPKPLWNELYLCICVSLVLLLLFCVSGSLLNLKCSNKSLMDAVTVEKKKRKSPHDKCLSLDMHHQVGHVGKLT